jgi:hypothetical protein
MKKLLMAGLACALALALWTPAQAGEWSTGNGDFTVNFWKEVFRGGGPGQPGNTLRAVGQGLHFRGATLSEVYWDDRQECWVTTYVDGMLLLNPAGPWLDRGTYKAWGITATNCSNFDSETGWLEYTLTFEGWLRPAGQRGPRPAEYPDGPPLIYFEAEASYSGFPTMGVDGNGIPFQRGNGDSMSVWIFIDD